MFNWDYLYVSSECKNVNQIDIRKNSFFIMIWWVDISEY